MKLNSIKQIKNLKTKRVLLRLDLNVPIKKGKIRQADTWRLEQAVLTVNYLANKGARVIILAHLGRPNGKKVKALSLRPVAEYLSKLTGRAIDLWDNDLINYQTASQELAFGQVVMLENIRFHPQEKKNCKRLAKTLSKLADIYVNDAFGNIHRQHTSMLAITEFLPCYAGLRLIEEVKQLTNILQIKKGLVFLLGGAKVVTKIELLKRFIRKADYVLLGGMVANTFLVARGYDLGHSLLNKEELALAKKLTSKKLILPLDMTMANSLHARQCFVADISQIPIKMMAVDIGPKTLLEYSKILAKAKVIVWNGPLGYFENNKVIDNSIKLAKKLSKMKAKTIIGGGETVAMITRFGLRQKFDFISTGGGAMIAFLEGHKLPVLEKLKIK